MPLTPPQARSLEIYRLLGLLPDLQRLGGPLPPLRAYQLPGGTLPVRTWHIVETPAPTPDRPHVRRPVLSSQHSPARIARRCEGPRAP